MHGLVRRLDAVGPIVLCSHLWVQLSQGKSVPTKVRCARAWFQDHSRAPIGASGVDVRDCAVSLTRSTFLGLVKVKQQAPPFLPVDSVRVGGLSPYLAVKGLCWRRVPLRSRCQAMVRRPARSEP